MNTFDNLTIEELITLRDDADRVCTTLVLAGIDPTPTSWDNLNDLGEAVCARLAS